MKKGNLREWMTVARDIPTWGTIVESRLGLPPQIFAGSDEKQMTIDKLA
jgi:hypothetical protein